MSTSATPRTKPRANSQPPGRVDLSLIVVVIAFGLVLAGIMFLGLVLLAN